MRFSKGDRVRIKQSLTREMCHAAIIPYDFRGRECVFVEYRVVNVMVKDSCYGEWFVPPDCIEKINTCMFNKED